MAVLSDVMNEDENVFHCSRCYKAGSKSNKEMWSRRTREMLHAKHPKSVNEHKLRCKECTAQDHTQDTRAMQRLCPGPKESDTCNGCRKVLVHTEGPDCNVSKAQGRKRHGDRLCLECAAKKSARCSLSPPQSRSPRQSRLSPPQSRIGVLATSTQDLNQDLQVGSSRTSKTFEESLPAFPHSEELHCSGYASIAQKNTYIHTYFQKRLQKTHTYIHAGN